MFEQNPRRSGETAPSPSAPAPRRRLSQLAALPGEPEPPPGARPGPDGPPGDGDPPPGTGPLPAGRAGRLVERWLPAGLGSGPPERRRRVAVVAAALGVAAVAVVVAFLLADGPAAESPPPLPLARELPAGAAGPPRTTTARPADAEPLVVSVVGKVRTPGLVTVPPGARVADAVRAAGGARPGADLATLNLARRVADGEQLYVGVPSPPGMGSALPQAAPPGAGDGTGGSVPVDLNAAGREELESLPGIGEVTARSILDWRARHGRFTAVEQLREVDGIGDKRFERLRDLVSVR